MRKVWRNLLLVFWLVTGIPLACQGAEIKKSELYAHSACLMDADSGRILYGKEEQIQLPMASTTKIMTCILALENSHGDELVTVSEYAASQPKVRLGAGKGEQFLLQDLLYALMLNSDNDVAVMLAEHIGGSVEEFARMMNKKAMEIGCENTYFITPNGLDAEDEKGIHSSTAADMAKILRYCVMESPQREMFLEITRMPSYTFWNNSHTKNYNCTNHNGLLGMMEGALTGKTGFTADAGYCYVGALRQDGKTLIVSLLACGWPNNKNYKWSDTKKLMKYGLENYSYRDIFERREFSPIPVREGQYAGLDIGEQADTRVGYGAAQEEMTFPFLLREDEEIQVKYELPEVLDAPVRKGQQVGKAGYYLDGKLLREYPIFAKRQVERRDFGWCLRKVEEEYKI